MRRISRFGGYLVGVAAGVAALAWLVKDRILGPEAAPVTPDDAPAFRVAPEPSETPAMDGDDLTSIVGIGPVYRARLAQAGFSTFSAVAEADASEVAAAADVTADRAQDWCDQAARLATE